MRVTGKRIDKMERVLRPGLTVLDTKGNIYSARNMDKETFNGQTDRPILESS